MNATIYKTDGSVIKTSPKNGTDFTFEELKSIVNGHLEVLFSIDGKHIMVLNEEGKIYDLPFNFEATLIAKTRFGLVNDYIVGDVLICDKEFVK